MAPCAEQVFSNLTPDQFACLAAKGEAAGIPISGNSGTASKLGGKVTWTYDPDAQRLTVQCLNTPFLTSCDTVNAKIQELVKGCLG
jgi:hypothetical protein